jgi:spermidine/putrescine transport system permease protein
MFRRSLGMSPPLRRLVPFLPAAVVLVFLFAIPIAFMTAYSFWHVDANLNIVPQWNLDNYATIFNNGTYLRAFGKTLLMAGSVTVAALAMAFPFAYFLARYISRRWAQVAVLTVIIPFWTSYLLRVYAWTAILGEKGVLNQVLLSVGLIHEPSRLFIYNDVGVFIVLLYAYFPFAALAMYASLDRFDFTQLSAAEDLGARLDQALRHILLPQIRPGIVTACLFVFVPTLGEFVTPTLVGGAGGRLIANSIVAFFQAGLIPQGAAIALVVAAVAMVLLVVFQSSVKIEDVVAHG